MSFPRPLHALLAASVCLLAGCGARSSALPTRAHPMGEKVPMGKLTYIVFETEYLTQIGEGPVPRIPQNRFFLVKLSVSSGASDTVSVGAFQVEDENGSVYP
ncbi:MAG TPA: hypothetical protein VEN79_00325, partial [Terriglobia bacterium]|nr:hypothetical protein [Terriglobia bacterium]